MSQFSLFPLGRSEPNVVFTRSDERRFGLYSLDLLREPQLLGVEIPVVTLGNILPRVLVGAIPSGFCT